MRRVNCCCFFLQLKLQSQLSLFIMQLAITRPSNGAAMAGNRSQVASLLDGRQTSAAEIDWAGEPGASWRASRDAGADVSAALRWPDDDGGGQLVGSASGLVAGGGRNGPEGGAHGDRDEAAGGRAGGDGRGPAAGTRTGRRRQARLQTPPPPHPPPPPLLPRLAPHLARWTLFAKVCCSGRRQRARAVQTGLIERHSSASVERVAPASTDSPPPP